MLDTKEFGEILQSKGYTFYTGVPCSWMKDLINYAQNDCEYYNAGNEGDAVAIAAGAYMAGRKTVVMMQNSGFGNAISPLTSLNYIFKIPSLIFISMREGSVLEPQHELMGQITDNLAYELNLGYAFLDTDMEKAKVQIEIAERTIDETNLPFCFLVNKDTFSKVALKTKEPKIIEKSGRGLPHYSSLSTEPKSRYETIQTIMQDKENTVFIGTTGMTGREMYDIEDNEHNLYMVGSMGCAAAIGLGIALNTNKRVVVIDGDGAAIMRLSVVPLVAEYAPKNLLHILLNNEVHDTTGGQSTLSHNIDWKDLMYALGYNHSRSVKNLNELSAAISYTKANPRLQFIEVKTVPGNKEGLGRPEITPVQVKERLMNYLKS